MFVKGRSRLHGGLAVSALIVTCSSQVWAQALLQTDAKAIPSKPLAYDVVSIRPDNQGPGSVRVSTNLDVYAATNVSLLDLLQSAYDLRPGMIFGEPKWTESRRFDIHAKVLDADAEALKKVTPEDRRRMLRDLLADRFHLKVHTETRTLPVYELVPVQGGSMLRDVPYENRNDAFNNTSAGSWSIHNGSLTGHFVDMPTFADRMSYQVNRTVLDRTNMPGHYNFQMNWTRDDAPATDESSAPSLFTALQEELGLKLVAAKDPVTVLVIDSVDSPTEN